MTEEMRAISSFSEYCSNLEQTLAYHFIHSQKTNFLCVSLLPSFGTVHMIFVASRRFQSATKETALQTCRKFVNECSEPAPKFAYFASGCFIRAGASGSILGYWCLCCVESIRTFISPLKHNCRIKLQAESMLEMAKP